MKPKTLILMLVAVGCGLIAAFLASQYQAAPQQDTDLLWVAAQDWPAGTAIREPEKMFVTKPYLKSSIPPKAVRNLEDLRGKVISRNMDAGAPITSTDISSSLNELFKPAPPGFQAVTFRLDNVNAHAGFLLPGSRVDLICNVVDLKHRERSWTVPFMQNVMVLAVNQLREQPKESAVVNNPTTLTVAVKPEDVLRIVRARERGNIGIGLRRPGDDTINDVNPVGEEEFLPKVGEKKEKEQATTKLWVARNDILPGQTIDKPEEFFELLNMPASLAAGAFTDRDTPPRNTQIVHFVAAGHPVTRKHYKAAIEVAKAGKDPERTKMIIQVGTQQAQTVEFVDGLTVTPGTNPAPAPTPKPLRELLPTPGPGPAPDRPSEGPKEK
jgi:Flp pilus assembly protein CpaB